MKSFDPVVVSRESPVKGLYIGNADDATGELERVKKLLEQERAMFFSGPVVVFRWRNAPSWPVEYVSPNVEAFLGYGEEDFTSGRVPYESLIVADDLERVTEEVRANTASGAPYFEHRPYGLRQKNGGILNVADFTTILRDQAGAATHYLGYIVDMTASLAAQEDLRSSRQMLHLVLDAIPQGIFWKDRRSVFLGCNRYLADFASLRDPADIVGLTDYDLPWSREESDFFRQVDRRVMENDQAELSIIEPVHRTDGTKAWLRTNKMPLHDASGAVVGILGTFEDITEHRRLQARLEQANKLESLGLLAGGMAHDFNNFLTLISGNAELLQLQLPETSPLSPLLSEIRQVTQRAGELVKQMLSFSGISETSRRLLDLRLMIVEVTRLMRVRTPEGIELQFQAAIETPRIWANATELRQILMNLLLNAFEAIGQEDGVVSLRLGRLSVERPDLEAMIFSNEIEPGELVCLEVSDTGCGMTDDIRERIFDPFFTTKPYGRGLGVATVLGFVRGHGGAIDVESEPGVGTTFRVLFPPAMS